MERWLNKTKPRHAVGLLILLAAVPYLNALAATFTLDDIPNIREYPAVTGGFDLTEIFATPMPMLAYLYRPVTVLTYALNEAVTPGNAAAFHLVNLCLHVVVTILLYRLGLQLFAPRVALIAAALFAVHPLHTEAVTNVVGRAEVLVALFGLLSLLSAGAADATDERWPKRLWYGCAVLCFAIAVFCKESAVTLLPLVLLYRVTRRADPLVSGMWKELSSVYWLPYALCIGVFFYFRFLVVGTLGGVPMNRLDPLDNALGFVPWPVRLWSAFGVLWDYFGLLHLPLVLSADYSYNQVPLLGSWLEPRCLAGMALCATGVVAVLVCRPAVRFSVALPLVTLLLTANLLMPIGTIKAERLLYVPSIGWALLAAWAIDRGLGVQRYRTAWGTAVIAVVLAFGVRTWVRNADWQDNYSLFASTVRSAPNSAKAQYNFGSALQERGDHARAFVHYQRALAIDPRTDGATLGIGIGYQKAGRVDDAIAWYRKALAATPDFHAAHSNLCKVLFDDQRFAAAEDACRRGLRYHPTDANLLKGVGASLVALGETEKGADVLNRSLALNRDDDQLRWYIASLSPAVTQPGMAVEVVR